MNWPNLKHLSYLVALHEEQHFHRAAKRCFIGQSTLSAAIQNLEEQCASQIIERDNKHFVFTEFGNELVAKSRLLLEHASEYSDFANSGGDWQQGKIKIGVIPTIAPFIFSELLSKIKRDFPRLHTELSEDVSENVVQNLIAGKLDAAIIALPYPTPGCHQRIIARDDFYLVGKKETIELLPEPLNFSQLPTNSVYLLHAEHCMTEHAVSACNIAYQEQVNDLAASSIFTLLKMAEYQNGFTFIPDMAKRQGVLDNTQLQAVSGSTDAYREIALIWRKTSQRHALYQALTALLQELLQQP